MLAVGTLHRLVKQFNVEVRTPATDNVYNWGNHPFSGGGVVSIAIHQG